MSDDGGYAGSEVTAIDDIEIYDYDEYLAEFGEIPDDGIEEDSAEYDDDERGSFYGEDE